MNLYLLRQDVNTGSDTFDAIVVAAVSEDEARCVLPLGRQDDIDWRWARTIWAEKPDQVKAKHIGTAAPGITAGVILASFNAG